ncbi:MAG: hypothetical protein GF400_03160 [Candidatus Eisenbacteria bacterium]|nr:hypothetical protein [Candidatus Eisenbacteria bacterium]
MSASKEAVCRLVLVMLISIAALLASAASGTAAEAASTAEAPRRAEGRELSSTAREASEARESTYANVYVQTSAEYRACCHCIYTVAGLRLAELMEEFLDEETSTMLRPAVVMDLDQTVLDNSSFQTFLYENGLDYTPELWSRFEREGVEEVELVPGAKRFIERAEELGVTVVYLSNRNRANQEWTVRALARVGIDTTGIARRMYLKPEGGSSDKTPRRDAIGARHNVLMYFGDNLRDFSDVFEARELPDDASAGAYGEAVEDRAAAVDLALCHWGFDWFVLPNPMYGEWEQHIPSEPVDILRPTSMRRIEGDD